MAQDPQELPTTEVPSDETAREVLAPATPGAETLGSPDERPSTGSAPAEIAPSEIAPSEIAEETDQEVLAPATPGADTMGVDAEPETP